MRRWIWMTSASLAGIALLIFLFFEWKKSSGPYYQGTSLSEWIRGFEDRQPQANLEAADAVRHIGTNALPFLIARLQRQPPSREPEWKQSLRRILSQQSVIKFNLGFQGDELWEALGALDALGPLAKDAAPTLETMLHRNYPDVRAVIVLGRIGPTGEPILRNALTNQANVVRLAARVCLEMQKTNSEVLFPKKSSFITRSCQFNAAILREASREYRRQHPNEFPPIGVDSNPPPRLPGAQTKTGNP